MKYFFLFLVMLVYTSMQAQATREDFLTTINQYDQLICAFNQGDKQYNHIPFIAGKIAAISLWCYGIYKGFTQGDLNKIAMATLSGVIFGISVATVSKMILNGNFYVKMYYTMYYLEKKIHKMAHELNLTMNDIATIETSSFTTTTQRMLGDLQLDLLLPSQSY